MHHRSPFDKAEFDRLRGFVPLQGMDRVDRGQSNPVSLRWSPRLAPLSRNEIELFGEIRRNKTEQSWLPIFTEPRISACYIESLEHALV